MIAQFKKFSRKWSLLAAVIIVGLGIIGLTGAKESINSKEEAPIVQKELRTVIPNALEVTKTVSDKVDGQHIVEVEGRFNSSDQELSLTFLANEGKESGQLEDDVRRADEIKPLEDGWYSFKHKLIETTGNGAGTKNLTLIFHLKIDGKNDKGLLVIPAKQGKDVLLEEKDDEKNNEDANNKQWEVISRAYRVQGVITELDETPEADLLNSITIQVTKRIRLPGNPIDTDFKGQTLKITFDEKLSNAGELQNHLKKGTEIVVTFAQYAVPPAGKRGSITFLGGYLKDVAYFEDEKYFNTEGKEVKFEVQSQGVDSEDHEVDTILPAFNGEIKKGEIGKELQISDEKWTEIKKAFVEEHTSFSSDESDEIDQLSITDFRSISSWEGTLDGKALELTIYNHNPYQVFVSKYDNEERMNLFMDFYYMPWVFYGDQVRFQILSKGVGMSYDIPSGKFEEDPDRQNQEMEIFDQILGDLWRTQQKNNLSKGDEIVVAGNKAKVLDEMYLVIQFYP